MTGDTLILVLQLEPEESRDVHLPVVFTRKGKVEVTVKGSTMMQKDSHTIVIDVVSEVSAYNPLLRQQ